MRFVDNVTILLISSYKTWLKAKYLVINASCPAAFPYTRPGKHIFLHPLTEVPQSTAAERDDPLQEGIKWQHNPRD